MEAASSSNMLATTYKLTQHHKTEDCLAYNSYKKTLFKIYLQRHNAKLNAKLACTPTNNRFHAEVVSGTYSK
jgi:hypothetical protein